MNVIPHHYKYLHILNKILLYFFIFIFIFTPFTLKTYTQVLEKQIEIWNDSNSYDIDISTIHSVMDWTTVTVTSTIKVTWPQNDTPYIMPTRSLAHIKIIFPSILTYSIKHIPSINNNTLLETTNNFSISSEVFTQLLKNSILQQYLPDKNIYSINIIYTTQLLPILYQLILPQYNERDIPTTLSIEYQNNIEYSSIIFSTENDIPIVTNKTTLISFTPKLLPQVYGWDGSLIYTPEYFIQNSQQSSNRAYFYFDIENISNVATGGNPYIVIPQTINSEERGDITVSKTDTLTILNNTSLRNAIKQGKVFFALSNKNADILNYQIHSKNDTTP